MTSGAMTNTIGVKGRILLDPAHQNASLETILKDLLSFEALVLSSENQKTGGSATLSLDCLVILMQI